MMIGQRKLIRRKVDMEEKRIVDIFEVRLIKDSDFKDSKVGICIQEYVNVGSGKFHCWSIDTYCDPEGEVSYYPVAIVEMDDGSIKNVYSENIRFRDGQVKIDHDDACGVKAQYIGLSKNHDEDFLMNRYECPYCHKMFLERFKDEFEEIKGW